MPLQMLSVYTTIYHHILVVTVVNATIGLAHRNSHDDRAAVLRCKIIYTAQEGINLIYCLAYPVR